MIDKGELFLKSISLFISKLDDKINLLNVDIFNIKNQIKEMNDDIKQLDEYKSLHGNIEDIELLLFSLNKKYNLALENASIEECFNDYRVNMTVKAKQDIIKGILYFQSEIYRRIYEKEEELEKIVYKNSNLETAKELISLEKGKLIKPIDSVSTMNMITDLILEDKGLTWPQRNNLMRSITKMNLDAFKERDKHIINANIEAKKRKIVKQIEKNSPKSGIFVEEKYYVKKDSLTTKEKELIKVVQQIMIDNQKIYDEGFANDIQAPLELIKKDNVHEYKLETPELNLRLVLADLQFMINNNTYDEKSLTIAIDAYNRFHDEVLKNMFNNPSNNSIKKLEQDNEVLLDKVKELVSSFNEIDSKLNLNDRNIIISLDQMTENDEEKKKNLSSWRNVKVTFEFYKEYKILSSLNDYYELYNDSDTYEDKKNCLDELDTLVKEYNILLSYIENIKEVKAILNHEDDSRNYVLYLNDENNISLIADYIVNDSYDYHGKITNYLTLLDKLRTSEYSSIFSRSDHVLGSSFGKKLRKLNKGDMDVIYLPLPKFHFSKKCYIAVALGKNSQDLFDYVGSKKVEDAVNNLINTLKIKYEEIEASSKSNVECKNKFEEWFKKFVSENNGLFLDREKILIDEYSITDRGLN